MASVPLTQRPRRRMAATTPQATNATSAPGFGVYDPRSGFQRDATLANNARTRFLIQQRGQRDLANLDIQNTAGLEKLGATFGRRGMVNSGVYQQAQTDYANSWMNQRQGVMDGLYEQLVQLGESDAGAVDGFQNSIAEKEQAKYNEILQTAAALRSLNSYGRG